MKVRRSATSSDVKLKCFEVGGLLLVLGIGAFTVAAFRSLGGPADCGNGPECQAPSWLWATSYVCLAAGALLIGGSLLMAVRAMWLGELDLRRRPGSARAKLRHR